MPGALVGLLSASGFSSDPRSAAIWLLIACFLLWRGIATLCSGANPLNHRVVNDLAAWGDPLEVCAHIQSEIDLAPLRYVKFSSLTRSWILYDEAAAFFAVPLQEVVWAYRKDQEISSDLSGTYTEYSIEVRTVRGTHYTLAFGSGLKSATHFLEVLSTRVPWIRVGYSTTLNDYWNKSHEQFIAEVLQRRPGFRGTAVPRG